MGTKFFGAYRENPSMNMGICQYCGKHMVKGDRYKHFSCCKVCVKELTKDWYKTEYPKLKQRDRGWRVCECCGVEYQITAKLQRHCNYCTYYGRSKLDINFKLARILRGRFRQALKNKKKIHSHIQDLGCSIKELKEHLEEQFKEGMSWSNYGKWHIDHIIPLSYFDLSNSEEALEAIHYTNLQPLWAEDNLTKSDKV